MENKHWSIATALKQIGSIDFTCEAGPLSMNAAWIWLNKAAAIGPKFWPGQGVYYDEKFVAASGSETIVRNHFYIIGCHMGSDTEKRLWTYTISNDPPSPYHYGKASYTEIKESALFLEQS